MTDKGMTTEQRFFPSEIYTIHRVIDEERVKIQGEFLLNPSLFSKHSRQFHWLSIADDRWDLLNFCKKINQNMIDAIEKYPDPLKSWKEFADMMPELNRFKLAIEKMTPLFEGLCGVGGQGFSCSQDKYSELHRHILSLYEGYQHDSDVQIDGIVYRNLKRINSYSEKRNGITHVFGTPSNNLPKKGDYPWLQATFFSRESDELHELPLFDIEGTQISSTCWHSQDADLISSNDTATDELSSKIKELAESPGFHYQQAFRSSLFPYEGKWDELENPSFYIVPLYDAQFNNQFFGNIWGNLTFLLEEKNRKNFRSQNKKTIDDIAYLIIRELRHSAITSILSQPIEPPYDLISHFVQHLRILQDWERITVFQKEGEKFTPQYCYRWHKDNKNGKPSWKACDCIQSVESAVAGCCENWESLDEETDKNNKKYLRWKINFWDEAFIPGISKEEQQQYGSIYLAFEYPITSVIPSGDETRKALDDLYVRQQLEVLRGLLSKIRARRSALRNAAVSIMGRNMSHNIGSHVLARYSASKLEKTNKPNCLECEGVKEKYKSDVNKLQSHLDKCINSNKNNCYACNKNIGEYDLNVKQFIRYLQERMDFIADMSTTDVYYSMPTAFFEEALTGLFGKLEEIPEQKILLKYISGVDNVQVGVHVEKEPGEDLVFASPGGQLGLQALYVILENIARNTAKHGNDDWTIKKNVKVEQDDKAGTLILSFHHDSLSDCSKVMLQCKDINKEFKSKDIKKVVVNGQTCKEKSLKGFFKIGKAEIDTKQVKDGEDGDNKIIFQFRSSVTIPKTGNVSVLVQRDVVLHVKVRPIDLWEKKYLEVLVWDNSRNCSPEEDEEWLPEKINRKMIHPVIDDSGAIKQGAWGIREIFLAAAYLRSISLSELEERGVWPEKVNKYTSSPPILEALAVDPENPPTLITKEDNKRGQLAYRFYLKKDLILLELYEDEPWAENNPVLGTKVYNAKELSELLQRKSKEGLTHSYGLFSETIFQNLDHTERLSLPVMHFTKKDFEQKKAPTEKDEIELLLAKTWWDKHLNNRIGVTEDNFVICRTGPGGSEEGGVEYICPEELKNKLNEDINRKFIVFDDHYQISSQKDDRETFKIINKAAFYEPFRSKDPQHAMLRDNTKKELNEILFKIAALTRIIILDERVQDQLSETYDNSWKWEQLFPLAGIVIPSRNGEIDLNEIKGQKEKFFPWLEKINNKESNRKIPFDFIVIHQGIIDKLREEMGKDTFDYTFQQQAEKMGCRDRIIVCSGRGNPRESLPHYARFIPVSGLLRWVIANPSKFNLVNLLSHARHPQGN